MPAKEYAGWLKHYCEEPWGNKEAGLRTGYLAIAASQVEGLDPEGFIVALPTKAEEKEREEWEQQAREFEAMGRKRRAQKDE